MSDKTGKTGTGAAADVTTESVTTENAASGRSTKTRAMGSWSAARTRATIARVVWVACLLIALILAAAAFSFALKANPDNQLVIWVRDLADVFDVGIFDLENPVWSPGKDEPNADVKTALANYGAAAVAYLIVGRFAERVIRP